VPTKDVAQQDIQALHRVRERLMGERTALVNEVHGLMHEYGIVMPKGVSKFRQAVVGKLEAEKDKLTLKSQKIQTGLFTGFYPHLSSPLFTVYSCPSMADTQGQSRENMGGEKTYGLENAVGLYRGVRG